MWSVYVLFSATTRRTYVGCAEDVPQRLLRHNRGQVTATRHGRPWAVLFTRPAGSYADARRMERYYKTAAGRRQLAKIFQSSAARLPAGAS